MEAWLLVSCKATFELITVFRSRILVPSPEARRRVSLAVSGV